MKCYYHNSNEAIAICKACGKAICVDCAVDMRPGMACKNQCEADVSALNLLLERQKKSYKKTGDAYRRSGIFGVLIGLVFITIGGLPIIVNHDYRTIYMAILGCLFLLWGVFNFKKSKQIKE